MSGRASRAAVAILVAFAGAVPCLSAKGQGAHRPNIAVAPSETLSAWSLSCDYRHGLCQAERDGLSLWGIRQGPSPRFHLRTRSGLPERMVLILDDGTSLALTGAASATLDRETLELLARPGTRLWLEERGSRPRIVPLRGVGAVVAVFLRVLSDPASPTTVGSARAEAASLLERYQEEERARRAPLPSPIPQTKPQVEFAIRAQGGVSIADSSGRLRNVPDEN